MLDPWIDVNIDVNKSIPEFRIDQKPNSDENVNEVSTADSRSKQATDILMNALRIGKVLFPNLDQLYQLHSIDVRQFGKPSMAKVCLENKILRSIDNKVQNYVKYSGINLRDSGYSGPLLQFGTTAFFNSSYLTSMPAQSTNGQSGKNVGAVYQRTPSKDPQMNGADMMLPVVAPSSPNDLNSDEDNAERDVPSVQTAQHIATGVGYNTNSNRSPKANRSSKADIMSSSYTNTTNAYHMGQGHQSQFSRSSSFLVTNQSQKHQTGMTSGLQTVGQPKQCSYMTNSMCVPSTMNDSGVSHLSKVSNVGQNVASMQTGQHIATGLGYNTNSNRSPAVTAASKPQINQTIMNPATNPSFQTLTTAVPYMSYDQASYLNALGILSPQGIPFNTLPFDLSSLSQVAPMGPNSVARLRDVQNLISGAADAKQQYNRNDGGMSGANNSMNAPPGLGAPTANNAEQAAQLMTPAGYQFLNPMQTMQAPFFAPFVVPTITNSTASTVSSGNQYGKNNIFSPPVFYNQADLQMLDYSKNLYGVSASQTKQATGSNVSLSSSDVNNKAFTGLKNAFDSKSFQNTNTPPPGIGNVGYPTGYPSTGGAPYYQGFIPPHVSMMPPNPHFAHQAASLNSNDVLSGGSQRPGYQVNKNATLYSKNPYWPN